MEAQIGQLSHQEIERVFMLGEHQEPLVLPREVLGDDGPELLELGFGDALLVALGKVDESLKILDLGLQLGHRPGHREALDEVVFEPPAVGFGQIVKIVGQLAVLLLQFAEFLQVSEPFETSPERQPDRCHARRQSALKYRKSQADVAIGRGFGPESYNARNR